MNGWTNISKYKYFCCNKNIEEKNKKKSIEKLETERKKKKEKMILSKIKVLKI
jgi:hypothetical protein